MSKRQYYNTHLNITSPITLRCNDLHGAETIAYKIRSCCFQFDKAYKPTRLGNWEVPKWHLNRPKGRSTVTKVIANDRGHLLPGVQKTDQKHWAGLYLGTYQLPKRISKDTGNDTRTACVL